MSVFVLSGAHVSVADIAAIAAGSWKVAISPDVLARLAAARLVLDGVGARGQPIYGYNTGLGANLKTAIAGDEAAFQRQLLEGRSAAVGPILPTTSVRAIMFTRAAMLSAGGSGISPHVLSALIDALNAGIHPVMPSLGSIGAGDLVVMTALAHALIGEGEAEFRGRRINAGEALKAAGLAPVTLAPKDGLSLINASSLSVGSGALAVVLAQKAFDQQTQATALTMEGLGANCTILDPRIQAARPAPGQVKAADALRRLLDWPGRAAPTTLQDPLSVRCAPSIHGALLDTLMRARNGIELEANSAGDNPLVVMSDSVVMSTGNFHTPALALAFEALGLAIAQTAAASAARFIQLTGPSRNGLPKYLSPVGGASAGFVPLQKTVVSILAAIRHKANPVMLDFLPVSEGVEDHATQTPLTISKCTEMIDLWRRLTALEMLAAAQAADLRQECGLAPATQRIHAAIRSHVAPLAHDRPLGVDAEALYTALSSQEWPELSGAEASSTAP